MLTVTTAPTERIVSIEQARAHCRVSSVAEDALLTLYVAAAVDRCAQYTGRTLAETSYRYTLESFDLLRLLPKAPIISIDGITYKDAAGDDQILSETVYFFDAGTGYVMLKSGQQWPETDGSLITIDYTAGYPAGTTPSAIKHAALLFVGDAYGLREATTTDSVNANPTARALLDLYVLGASL